MSLYKDEKEKEVFDFVKKYSSYTKMIKAYWNYIRKNPRAKDIITKPKWQDFLKEAQENKKWEVEYERKKEKNKEVK